MGEKKHLSLRIDEDLLKDFHSVAEYYGRSANSQLIVMIRRSVAQFKKQYGEIEPTDD